MINYERTLVFSDFHGDLDIMAKSFAAKDLMTYDGNVEELINTIKKHVKSRYSLSLEKLMIKQKKPVRLFFLGDCLDRYTYGCYIVQFFIKIRWERFNIYPIFLLGNHDLLNFLFMVNPFKIYKIHHGSGHSYSEVVEYIERMGIDKSIENFIDLHGDELINLQKKFYREGKIDFLQEHHSTTMKYNRNYSSLANVGVVNSQRERECLRRIQDALGLEISVEDEENQYKRSWRERRRDIAYEIRILLHQVHDGIKNAGKNWWDIRPPDIHEKTRYMSYGDLEDLNIIKRNKSKHQVEILPVDWRVISMVWRKHYGIYFRKLKHLFLENSTIYVHGGISLLSMMDPMILGNLYSPLDSMFRKPDRFMDLGIQVERSNRLVSQILKNALNDYSFEDMSGAEVIDLMGFWRGCCPGFPQFGGPLWADFEYLELCLKSEDTEVKLLEFYKKFCETYGIKRIICGHTPFFSFGDHPGPRMKKIKTLEEKIGLQYICIDNGCSRAYRRDKPVVNGIEIDTAGGVN
jgi:hypothetical protein